MPTRNISFIAFTTMALVSCLILPACRKPCYESEAAYIEVEIHPMSGPNPYANVTGLGRLQPIVPSTHNSKVKYRLHTSFSQNTVKYLFHRDGASDTLAIYYRNSEPFYKNDVCGYAVSTTIDSVRGMGFTAPIVKRTDGTYEIWQ